MILYHGSPFSDISEFRTPSVFLTKDYDVAVRYATTSIIGAQRDQGGHRQPTVYSVETGGTNVLDLRKHSHQLIYEKLRANWNAKQTDDDYRLPKLQSLGFIDRVTGLPFFGQASLIVSLLEPYGFTGMWVREAVEHGVALLAQNSKRLKIVKKEQLGHPTTAAKIVTTIKQDALRSNDPNFKPPVKLKHGKNVAVSVKRGSIYREIERMAKECTDD